MANQNEQAKTIRLALVLSGAISLGSYEAGALYELARAVKWARQHERDFGGEPLIEIDTIVGASAGAMTGALLAYILLTDNSPEILYDVWVTHPDIRELLETPDEGRVSPLSNAALDIIADKVFGKENGKELPPSDKQRTIRYVAMLTNLEGLHYEIYPLPVKGEGQRVVPAFTHRDWKAMVLTPDGAECPNGKWSWRYVAEVALASGAHPLAFAPRSFERPFKDYNRKHIRLASGRSGSDADTITLFYSDGGVMANEPLGLAFDALYDPRQIGLDAEPVSDENAERIVLLIHPRPIQSREVKETPPPLFFEAALKVVGAMLNISDIYQDLLQAQKVNSRLYWKEQFLTAMECYWESLEERYEQALQQAVKALMEAVLTVHRTDWERKRQREEAVEVWTEETCWRELLGYERQVMLQDGKYRAKLAHRLFSYLLDMVSGTKSKRWARIEVISPMLWVEENPEQRFTVERLLCGEEMGHFGGFFREAYRESDFNLGRDNAQRWLRRLMNDYLHLQPLVEELFGNDLHKSPYSLPHAEAIQERQKVRWWELGPIAARALYTLVHDIRFALVGHGEPSALLRQGEGFFRQVANYPLFLRLLSRLVSFAFLGFVLGAVASCLVAERMGWWCGVLMELGWLSLMLAVAAWWLKKRLRL